MMRAHIIDVDGTILNTIIVKNLEGSPNLVDADIGGAIGDKVVNNQIVKKAPKVPEVVPMLNAQLVMIEAQWFDNVETYIDSIPGKEGKKAKAYWAKALTMRRDNPLVLGIPAALGKTEAEVDALFIAAEALVV